MCEIIVFTGGEGSPGRTFLAFNTSVILGMMGFGVTMIETQGSESGIAAYFNLESLHDCKDLVSGNCSPEDAIIHCGGNLDLIVQGTSAAIPDGNQMGRLLTLAADFEKRDFIIVDAPAGISEGLLPIILASTEVFTVVTPELTDDSRNFWFIRDLGKLCGDKPIHVILNRSPGLEISDTICNRLEHYFGRVLGINMDCTWFIPEDPQVREASQARLPFVTFAPDSETALRIVQLATAIEFARRERYRGKMRTILQGLLLDLQSENTIQKGRVAGSDISNSEIRFLQRAIMEALNSEEINSVNFKNIYDDIREIMLASQGFAFNCHSSDRSVGSFQEAYFAS